MSAWIARTLVIAATGLAVGAPANALRVYHPPVPTEWRSTQLKDHPLVGMVWSTREPVGRSLAPKELQEIIGKARFVLLGEVHDNPDHHRLQAWAVAWAGKELRFSLYRPIAFEMLMEDQRKIVADFLSQIEPDLRRSFYYRDGDIRSYGEGDAKRDVMVEEFGRVVGWEKSGWPPFELYKVVFNTALNHGWTIVPASPSRERTRAVSKDGFAALGEAETARLALDRPLEAGLASALDTELVEGHCGMLPAEAARRMAPVQSFRDAVMADALLGGDSARTIADGSGAILIAGNGHVRRDRGVPYYLERRGVAANEIVSIMHVEVEEGKTDPAAYVPRAPDGTPAADFLWFTPRQERGDPCEGLRRNPRPRPAG